MAREPCSLLYLFCSIFRDFSQVKVCDREYEKLDWGTLVARPCRLAVRARCHGGLLSENR